MLLFSEPRYPTACKEMTNTICRVHGTASNRPGTKLVAEAYATGGNVRLIDFQFNVSQSYVLEFGHHYIRVLTNSGVVADDNNSDVVIETDFDHNDLNKFRYEQSNDNIYLHHTAYPPYKLGRYSHTDWRLEQIMYGASIAYPANLRVSNAGKVSLALNNVGITSIDGRGKESVLSRVIKTTVDAKITWDEIEGAKKYQLYKQNAEGDWGFIYSTDLTYFCETNHASGGIDPDISSTPTGQATISPPVKINVAVPQSNSANTEDETCWDILIIAVDEDGKYSDRSEFVTVFLSQTLEWDEVEGADYYRVYKSENSAFGWVCNTPGTTFKDPDTDAGTLPDMKSTAPIQKLPFDVAGDYPAHSKTFKGRLLYSQTNSKPNTIFGSRTGDYENMNISNPSGDCDAFTWKVLSSQMNKIVWLMEYGDDLIIGTEGGIEMHSCGDDGLVPDSPNIVPSKVKGGCADMPALNVGDSLLYVEQGSPHIRDLFYTLQVDGYSGNDLSISAYHLFDDYEIVDWCFQRSPDGIVWIVRNDGTLLGLTYAKEYGVYAWHKHITDGKFLSCACITDGDYDNEVYFVIEREVEGVTKKFVEKFTRRIDNDPVEAFFADASVTYRGAPITTINTGLEHLEGKKVVVLADGYVDKTLTVTNGQVTLKQAAEVIHIGLPYVSRIATMNLISQTDKGVSIGVNQGIREVSVLFEKSWRCYVASSDNDPEVVELDDSAAPGKAVVINTGNIRKSVDWSDGYEAYVVIENRDPTPLTISGLVVKAEFGDD